MCMQYDDGVALYFRIYIVCSKLFFFIITFAAENTMSTLNSIWKIVKMNVIPSEHLFYLFFF